MMVYAVAYGAASFAVWRQATAVSNLCEKHYLVRTPAGSARGNERPGRTIAAPIRHFLI
jgi:hypothetical protein